MADDATLFRATIWLSRVTYQTSLDISSFDHETCMNTLDIKRNICDAVHLMNSKDVPLSKSEQERIKLTVSCRDTDKIAKHAQAGDKITIQDGSLWQVMHNGTLVEYGGYHGEWMAEIIRELKGHHEPQEELVFHTLIHRLQSSPTMIELGAFWAYYSLWFKHVHPSGKAHIFEPDPVHLALARRNFQQNNHDAQFELAAAGQDGDGVFYCESLNAMTPIAKKSVDTICAQHQIGYLDILHMDIQGSELEALYGAINTIEREGLRFIIVSTHHHVISGDPLTHHKCLSFLRQTGAHIICEHSVHESYSGDGLIVASYSDEDRDLFVPISRARASVCLFRELEFDLADMKESHPAVQC